MIKGCAKKVIVVKDTGSDIFDEAYFIVNPRGGERRRSDFLAEANRIIESRKLPVQKKHRSRLKIALLIVLGFICGAAAAFPAAFFLM